MSDSMGVNRKASGLSPIVAAALGAFLVASTPLAAAPFFGNQTDTPISAQPAENLLLIIADIQRHIRDDVYRFPYPVTANGQNVFRAGIVQLSNYERAYPGRMRDLIALAKAQAFERLCSFQEAGANYQAAQKSEDEKIRIIAEEGFARAEKFSRIVDVIADKSSPRTYERDVRVKLAELDGLEKQHRGTPYECLVHLERERAEMQLAEFYVSVRFIQPYTTHEAIAFLKKNVETHKASKLLYTHRLRLADLYFELAKEYSVLNDPEGPDFELTKFEGFAKSARAEYSAIEQADGYDEKAEGRAKLTALQSFMERIIDRSR